MIYLINQKSQPWIDHSKEHDAHVCILGMVMLSLTVLTVFAADVTDYIQ